MKSYKVPSASLSHAFAKSFANPSLKILNTSSPLVPEVIPRLQSQPRLIGPFTKTPLLLIDCFNCEASIELPTIEKLLVPLMLDVDFRSMSCGVDPLRPCPDAITVCKNSVHAVYTRGPTACKSSMAFSNTSICVTVMTEPG